MVSYADRDEVRDQCGFLETELVLGSQVDASDSNSIHLLQNAIAIDLLEISGLAKVGGGVDYTFIKPKRVEFMVLPADNIQIQILYQTELRDSQIDKAIFHAKQETRRSLGHRVPDSVLTEWDIATPDEVTSLSTEIACLKAEKIMLKQSHDYGFDAAQTHQMELKNLKKELKGLDDGDLALPGLSLGQDQQSMRVVHGSDTDENFFERGQTTRDHADRAGLDDPTEGLSGIE